LRHVGRESRERQRREAAALKPYEARIAPVMESGIRPGRRMCAIHAITSTALAARRVKRMPASAFHFPFSFGRAPV
jgi:hypothetical protein